jgi:hypothetical protein
MSLLEQRYRSVLRLLPAAYRQRWEEDMVAAFLESAETGDPQAAAGVLETGHPSVSELASIVSLAVRLRLGDAGSPPGPLTWGRAVRLATMTATLAHAVVASGGILVSVWLSGRMGWLPQPPQDVASDVLPGVWREAWTLTAWCWVPAWVALVLGRCVAAQLLASLAVAVPALGLAGDGATGDSLALVPRLVMLTADVLLILAMGVFSEGEPSEHRPRWLIALPISILLVPLPLLGIQLTLPATRLLDWPGVACVVLALATVVHAAATARRPSRRDTPTLLALTLLAASVAAVRLLTLPGYYHQADRGTLLTIGLIQAATVSAAGLPLAVATRRALRRVPALTTAGPQPAEREETSGRNHE